MINIGQYIESAINWMMVHFSTFFDAVNSGIGSFIIGFQHVLFGIPFYITILALAVAAWMKAGRGTAIFTVLGLLLIYGMGFWEATMQTLALVLSSTCLALVVGVPLGIWTANSPRADKILRPILDLMHACFCLPDSRCPFLRLGSSSGSVCDYHFRHAARSSSYRIGNPASP